MGTDSNLCSVSPLSGLGAWKQVLIVQFRGIHLAKAKVECYIINAWLILKWWVTFNKDYIIEKELSVPFKDSWDSRAVSWLAVREYGK